jgi:acetyl esterase/lipase
VHRFAATGLLLLLVLAPSAAAASPGQPISDIRVTNGIVYGHGEIASSSGQKDLLLDLYEPATHSNGRRPAIVLIHGGGFLIGTRAQPELVRVAKGLAERGNVVASIDYRLIGDQPLTSTRVAPLSAAVPPRVPIFNAMVAAVDDALTALDWMRTHEPELRINPNRLGIAGGSAGAITADHVAYALDDFGIAAPRLRFVGDLWGGIFIPFSDLQAAADQLERGEASLFAVHGSADTTVPIFLDDMLVARAKGIGVPVEYHRIEGGRHGFGGTGFFTREVAAGQTAFDRMLDFAQDALHPGRS